MERRENLVDISCERRDGHDSESACSYDVRESDNQGSCRLDDLHGTQCGAAALVQRGVHSGQHTTLCTEPDVPSLLVKMEALCIKLIKEVRVANVQLMGGYTDNWTWWSTLVGE
jgi:hypothetical protein